MSLLMIHKAYMPVHKIFIADRASQVEQEDLKNCVFPPNVVKTATFRMGEKGPQMDKKGLQMDKKEG